MKGVVYMGRKPLPRPEGEGSRGEGRTCPSTSSSGNLRRTTQRSAKGVYKGKSPNEKKRLTSVSRGKKERK